MSRSRIILMSSSGEILCEAESALAGAPVAARQATPPDGGESASHEEPCPPTKRSPQSGFFDDVAPRAA